MRIFGAVFWAILLIVIGVIIILNQTFGWHISIFPIVIGIVLIFIGISIITGPTKNGINGVFANHNLKSINNGDNSYVFSSVTLSLDDVIYDKVEINSIFSSVKLLTNGKSVKIESNGVFSSTQFPDKSSLAFGERVYERNGKDKIFIETNCVFGSIEIE